MPLRVRDQCRCSRKGQAHHERRGQDHDRDGQGKVGEQRPEVRGQGKNPGTPTPADKGDHPEEDESRDDDLAEGQQVDRPNPGPVDVEGHRTEGQANQEDRQDRREHVGRITGSGSEQADPQDLVAERGQAGHVGHDQGQPDARSRPADRRECHSGARLGQRARRRLSCVGGQRGPTMIQDQGRDPGDRRAGGADEERAGQAQQLDQDEAGGDRPDDRPERVGGIQPPERRAQVRWVTRQVAGQRGQRGPHQDRRRPKGHQRQAEADQREDLRTGLETVEGAPVDLVEQPECDRRQEHDDDQDQLEQAIHPERAAGPVGNPPSDHAADRDSPEEPSQDCRDGLGRVTEDEDELAGPHDFVDQARGARQDEDRENGPATAHEGTP